MIVLFVLAILAVGVAIEAWTFMLAAGIAHAHLLDAMHPISYGVSLSLVLASLPVQIFAVGMSALGDA